MLSRAKELILEIVSLCDFTEKAVCVFERERERQTDRETDTHTQRERDRERQKRERERGRERERETDRQTDRQTDRDARVRVNLISSKYNGRKATQLFV